MAANGQKLRVAVTKTSAQGKSVQSATPNLMSFSTDENSIWFNGKKYGATLFKNVFGLSTSSSNSQITAALGGYAFSTISSMVNEGILFLNINNKALQHVMIRIENKGSSEGDYLHIQGFSDTSDTAYIKIRHYSGSFNVAGAVQRDNIIFKTDIVNEFAPLSDKPLSANMGMKLNDEKLDKKDVENNLTSTDTTKALSAAQGKRLNDEKLAKTDVVNNLSDSSTNKALSAAQGKILNDKLSSNIIVIDTNKLPEGVTTEDQVINEALGGSGIELYNAFKSGATIVDSGNNIIYPSLVNSDHIIFNVLYLLNEPTVHTKIVELKFSSTGQYSSCKVTSKKYPIPGVENSLSSNNAANALSAAQGKVLNDKISALGSVYRVKGSKTNISEVLALIDAKVGDVWNIINDFTLNRKPFPANTNIVCTKATSSSDHDEDNWDSIGGTVDLSPYAKKTDVEKGDNEILEQLNVVVKKNEIVNDLTSTNTDKPLSAQMGKKLQDEKLSKTDASNTYLAKVNAESTYAKKADGISHYSIGELTVLNSNPTQEQLKNSLGTPSAFKNAIGAGKLILVNGNANVQSQKSATCIIDSGNVIVKYLHPGNNDWTVIAKCVPASSDDNWDSAQFSIRTVKPLDFSGIIIE